MTQLSEQQRQALRDHPDKPVEVLDEVTQSSYVLMPSRIYARVQALFEPTEFHPDEAAVLMDEVAASEGWSDPAMDAYDALITGDKQ